jgi:hypothetical protein
MYAIAMAACGMINIPSFMTNSSVIQGTLRLLRQQLRSYSIGIIDGRDL